MAAISWTDVTDLASRLVDVPPARQTKILAYVNNRLPVEAWGGEDSEVLFEGRINLAAYMGTLALQGSGSGSMAAGAVTSVSEGDVTVQFANPGAGIGGSGYGVSALDRNQYGQEFRRLARTTGGRLMKGCP